MPAPLLSRPSPARLSTVFSSSRALAKDCEEDFRACARVRSEVVRDSCSCVLWERRVSVVRVWEVALWGKREVEVEVAVAVVWAVSGAWLSLGGRRDRRIVDSEGPGLLGTSAFWPEESVLCCCSVGKSNGTASSASPSKSSSSIASPSSSSSSSCSSS